MSHESVNENEKIKLMFTIIKKAIIEIMDEFGENKISHHDGAIATAMYFGRAIGIMCESFESRVRSEILNIMIKNFESECNIDE